MRPALYGAHHRLIKIDPDEQYNEVIKYIEFLKENPS